MLDRQLHAPVSNVGFFGIYRYASRWDLAIVLGSSVFAIAGGAALPMFTVSSLVNTKFQDGVLTIQGPFWKPHIHIPRHHRAPNHLLTLPRRAHQVCRLLRLPRRRRVRDYLHRDRGIHLHRRSRRPAHSRRIPSRHPAPEHRLLRHPRRRRSHDTNHSRYKHHPRWDF